LLGSSALNYSLKFYTYNWYNKIIYLGGIFLFLLGLIYSVRITNRFKEHEISWKVNYPNPIKKTLENYCLELDESFSFQHTCLYTLWLPAVLLIGITGFITEMKISKKSEQNQAVINSIERKLESLENVKDEVKQIKETTNSLSNKIDNINAKTPESLESNKMQSVSNKKGR
jgi:hypothetical protein